LDDVPARLPQLLQCIAWHAWRTPSQDCTCAWVWHIEFYCSGTAACCSFCGGPV
jgi:hypothetical protein